MKYNYEHIKDAIDSAFLVHFENNFAYFLDEKRTNNILIEERADIVVVWDCDYSSDYQKVVCALMENCDCDIVFPLVQSQALVDVLNNNGAAKIEFEVDKEDECENFGSYKIVRG